MSSTCLSFMYSVPREILFYFLISSRAVAQDSPISERSAVPGSMTQQIIHESACAQREPRVIFPSLALALIFPACGK